jgi:hypothetical protein
MSAIKLLYHTTTADRADNIMACGFRDYATVNKRLTATHRYEPGVWFGDVPALDDDLFDGVGLFNFDAERQAFIAVNLYSLPYANPYAGIQSSSVDTTWPGTQFWAKAAVWNRFPRKRVSLDEVIRLRLASADVRMIKKWLRRDYGVAFADRVRKSIESLEVGAAG